MAKMEKVVSYKNPITGEVIEKTSYVDMFYDDETGYMAWTKRKGVKTYMDRGLPDELSFADRGRVDELRHYILRDNQFLVYRSNGTIKPIGINQLTKILDLSERRCKLFMKKLKQLVIVKEVNFNGLTYYSFNPIYGMKDKRITLTLFLIFQAELRTELPLWVINKFLEQAEELKPNLRVIK